MLKKLFICVGMLFASHVVQAGIIEYNGYSRDESGNIVTGGGLEWLKWDLTEGLSINEALDTYAANGWRLASNIEMASMFNVFGFGATEWTTLDDAHSSAFLPWTDTESAPHDFFQSIFGQTYFWQNCSPSVQTECADDTDPLTGSIAIYGDDLDNDDRFKWAYVTSDYMLRNYEGVAYPNPNRAFLYGDSVLYKADRVVEGVGVALVRSVTANVWEPSTFSLMVIALSCLFFSRRRQNWRHSYPAF